MVALLIAGLLVLLVAGLGAAYWYSLSLPGKPYAGPPLPVTEGERDVAQRLRSHVEAIASEPHNIAHYPALERSAAYIEQNIGLKAHIQRVMPLFLTLRDPEGKALVTAMLPPLGKDERSFKPIVVGIDNTDPYPEHGDAIRQLARHYGLTLDPARCYPYRR